MEDTKEQIIDDWMSGKEIDPVDYDPYQVEELREMLEDRESDY